MASTSSTDPSATSNRNKTHPASPINMNMTFKSMSKISQSAELDEYTASMRTYLANVEHKLAGTGGGGGRSDSSDSGESGADSEREKSPEFRWMDLASVRREHGTVNLSFNGHGHGHGTGNGVSKTTKQTGHHTLSIGKDHRHHHHQHREYRSASPGSKADQPRNTVRRGVSAASRT